MESHPQPSSSSLHPVLSSSPSSTSPDVPAWDFGDNQIQNDLKLLESSLSFLTSVQDSNLMSSEEVLTFFENRDAKQEPEVVEKRFKDSQMLEEQQYDQFKKTLERKKQQWQEKKMKYIHDAHISVTKYVSHLLSSFESLSLGPDHLLSNIFSACFSSGT